jgi:predicted HAD superfamily phosphohydrolase YqeG
MVHRVSRIPVGSLDDVAAFAQSAPAPITLLFDVDNTIVPQPVDPAVFVAEVNAAIDRFEALPHVAKVIVLSNGPERGVPRMEARGNKPWTSRRRLGLLGVTTDVAVVGDQVLTDGVLAWRLGATFLHLVIDAEHENAMQATMRRAGRWAGRWLFVPESAV